MAQCPYNMSIECGTAQRVDEMYRQFDDAMRENRPLVMRVPRRDENKNTCAVPDFHVCPMYMAAQNANQR